MQMIALLFFGTGCVLVLISLPLIYRKIPMNRFYGIRMRASFRSDSDWYDINEYGGRLLAWWSAPIIVVGIAGFFVPTNRLNDYVAVASVVSLGSVLASLVLALLWVRRRKVEGP
jgi:hypothetical protein